MHSIPLFGFATATDRIARNTPGDSPPGCVENVVAPSGVNRERLRVMRQKRQVNEVSERLVYKMPADLLPGIPLVQ